MCLTERKYFNPSSMVTGAGSSRVIHSKWISSPSYYSKVESDSNQRRSSRVLHRKQISSPSYYSKVESGGFKTYAELPLHTVPNTCLMFDAPVSRMAESIIKYKYYGHNGKRLNQQSTSKNKKQIFKFSKIDLI